MHRLLHVEIGLGRIAAVLPCDENEPESTHPLTGAKERIGVWGPFSSCFTSGTRSAELQQCDHRLSLLRPHNDSGQRVDSAVWVKRMGCPTGSELTTFGSMPPPASRRHIDHADPGQPRLQHGRPTSRQGSSVQTARSRRGGVTSGLVGRKSKVLEELRRCDPEALLNAHEH